MWAPLQWDPDITNSANNSAQPFTGGVQHFKSGPRCLSSYRPFLTGLPVANCGTHRTLCARYTRAKQYKSRQLKENMKVQVCVCLSWQLFTAVETMRKKNIMPEINSLLENKAKIQSLARLLGIHTGFTVGVRFCRHPLMFVKPRQTHKHPLLSRQKVKELCWWFQYGILASRFVTEGKKHRSKNTVGT